MRAGRFALGRVILFVVASTAATGHLANAQAESKLKEGFPNSLFDLPSQIFQGMPGNRGERRQSGIPAGCTSDDIVFHTECVNRLEVLSTTADMQALCDYIKKGTACYPKCFCDDAELAQQLVQNKNVFKEMGVDCDVKCGGGAGLSFLADVAATGRFSHPSCNETRTMSALLEELAEDPSLFVSGGMSRDKGWTGPYTWMCFAGHPCMEAVGNETSSADSDDRMCYVMERREDRSGSKSLVFHAWGLNSELGLCNSTGGYINNSTSNSTGHPGRRIGEGDYSLYDEIYIPLRMGMTEIYNSAVDLYDSLQLW